MAKRRIIEISNRFTCSKCGGSRLKEQATAIKVNNKNIFEVTNLSIKESLSWFERLESKLKGNKKEISEKIIKDKFEYAEEVREEETLSIQDKELELIIKALERNNRKRKAAASELGISERTLYRKIKQYNIDL